MKESLVVAEAINPQLSENDLPNSLRALDRDHRTVFQHDVLGHAIATATDGHNLPPGNRDELAPILVGQLAADAARALHAAAERDEVSRQVAVGLAEDAPRHFDDLSLGCVGVGF